MRLAVTLPITEVQKLEGWKAVLEQFEYSVFNMFGERNFWKFMLRCVSGKHASSSGLYASEPNETIPFNTKRNNGILRNDERSWRIRNYSVLLL